MVSIPDSDLSRNTTSQDNPTNAAKSKPRLWTRTMIVIRRVHLYAGLFLLPWVFLYGITGAMFNHLELFPAVSFESFDRELLADSPMSEFPDPDQLAEQVITQIQAASGDVDIRLSENPGAEFTSDILFEVNESGTQYVVQIDPITQESRVVTRDQNPHQHDRLIPEVHNIKLDPDPFEAARQSASLILDEAEIETNQQPRPLGWTKLNFLAEIDGQPARITYVLKDGHVDIDQYDGHHGMLPRQFFLRLHTVHGQPPHWNGRMVWTFAIDAMAIAMVVWGVSGLLMWWQIKRTRVTGTLVILSSVLTAVAMYFSLHDFYATTRL